MVVCLFVWMSDWLIGWFCLVDLFGWYVVWLVISLVDLFSCLFVWLVSWLVS